MQYTDVIPKDITKLPKYSVPGQLFICTCVVIILLLILSLGFTVFWIYRTINSYSNTDYIADYEVKIQAERTMKKIAEEEESPQDIQFVKKCREFSRIQSRMLQFWTLAVIAAINIGTFSCGILEAVAFFIGVLLFFIFNVKRLSENKIARSVWILPLIICYIPYYVGSKQLNVL